MIVSDKKNYVVFISLAFLIVLLVAANLFLGSVDIPAPIYRFAMLKAS